MKLKRLILLLALAPWACTRFDEADRPVSEPEIPAEAVVVHDARNARRGSLLVKFTPEAAEELHITGGETRGGGPLGSGLDDIDHVLDRISALELQRVFPVTRHEERTRRAGLHLWYEITFDDTLPVDDVVELLRDKSGQISVLEYNHEICRVGDPAEDFEAEAPAAAPQAANRSYPVNDPQMSFQWNLNNDGTLFSNAAAGADVRAVEAWKYCMGSPDVVVCVVDEGVESDHPDLKANIWTNTREAAGSTLRDDDSNGYVDDIYGYNFVSNTGTVSCNKSGDTGHGTHVAGIIAAVNNNGTGVASIAGGSGNNDGVRIMSCQVFDDGKGAGIAGCARAIKYGADNGAVISQNSWGYSGTISRDKWLTTYSLEKDAIDYFTTFAGDEDGPMQGGLVFFSAGNDGYKILDKEKFPAAYEPVMAVASMAANYQAAYYTDYGSWVDITAPGGDYLVDRTYGAILSTTPTSKGTGYGYKQGTSMACPQMSGVAALAVSYAHALGRRITAVKLREILSASTYDIDPYLTGSKRFSVKNDDGTTTTYTIYMSDYRGKMGTGCIDAALAMRNILGADLPSADKGQPPVITPLDGTELVVEYWSSGSLRFDVTDPDGDEVTVTLSDNSSLLRLSGSGSAYTVTLKGSSTRVGSYTSTLTATDGTGKKSFVDISYTVKRNYQPQSTPFDDIRFADIAQKITIDAAPHFSDPNGETLSFEVSCSDPELLEITRSGSSFTLSAKRYGRGTVTVKGIDAGGLSATETFEAIARNENLVMEFYPVPVNDVLNIRMGADVTGSIRVKIFNTRGVKVMDTSKSISPAAPASILMSSLAPGNYTVEAAFGEITERRNIVKL